MSYSSTVLADSPRWYLRLGEASGTTAADASGNSLPGAYTTGGGTFTYSRPGLITDPDTAIKFNGSTPYVHVPDTQAYTSATLEAWVAPADTTDRSILIQSNGAPGSSYSLLLRTVGGKFQAHVFDGAARTALASTAFTVGVTYHVAATCTNSGSLLLYIDGVLETTTTGIGTMWTGNNDWFIGYTWNSDVDEVAVYTSVLSAAQLLAHHDAATPASTPIAGTETPTVAVTDTSSVTVLTVASATDTPTVSLTESSSAAIVGLAIGTSDNPAISHTATGVVTAATPVTGTDTPTLSVTDSGVLAGTIPVVAADTLTVTFAEERSGGTEPIATRFASAYLGG